MCVLSYSLFIGGVIMIYTFHYIVYNLSSSKSITLAITTVYLLHHLLYTLSSISYSPYTSTNTNTSCNQAMHQ